MNLQQMRETRVLDAVQQLGSPTVQEVAYRTGLTTRDTRAILSNLALQGLARRVPGWRWTVPSKALVNFKEEAAQIQDATADENPEAGCPGPKQGCGWLSILLVASCAVMLIAIRSCCFRVFGWWR
ncbi:hypothetical protein [Mesoterricola silvestris]|uniref:Uncharacterized protein n=1 Tax=Mesoterricola silvestris TaxID=2927979 RepID=A0AA48GN56_9BACT|nr:hypothetical protein [Mesoterricola silvestris]BDU72944.1 hypothetical protein METEAL_21180 [Mesoterricola silvestris]